jgi:hypothetical protein
LYLQTGDSVVPSHRGFDVVAVADELIAMLFFTKNDGLDSLGQDGDSGRLKVVERSGSACSGISSPRRTWAATRRSQAERAPESWGADSSHAISSES